MIDLHCTSPSHFPGSNQTLNNWMKPFTFCNQNIPFDEKIVFSHIIWGGPEISYRAQSEFDRRRWRKKNKNWWGTPNIIISLDWANQIQSLQLLPLDRQWSMKVSNFQMNVVIFYVFNHMHFAWCEKCVIEESLWMAIFIDINYFPTFP